MQKMHTSKNSHIHHGIPEQQPSVEHHQWTDEATFPQKRIGQHVIFALTPHWDGFAATPIERCKFIQTVHLVNIENATENVNHCNLMPSPPPPPNLPNPKCWQVKPSNRQRETIRHDKILCRQKNPLSHSSAYLGRNAKLSRCRNHRRLHRNCCATDGITFCRSALFDTWCCSAAVAVTVALSLAVVNFATKFCWILLFWLKIITIFVCICRNSMKFRKCCEIKKKKERIV